MPTNVRNVRKTRKAHKVRKVRKVRKARKIRKAYKVSKVRNYHTVRIVSYISKYQIRFLKDINAFLFNALFSKTHTSNRGALMPHKYFTIFHTSMSSI